jgi:hypothetical protein
MFSKKLHKNKTLNCLNFGSYSLKYCIFTELSMLSNARMQRLYNVLGACEVAAQNTRQLTMGTCHELRSLYTCRFTIAEKRLMTFQTICNHVILHPYSLWTQTYCVHRVTLYTAMSRKTVVINCK